MKSIPVPSLATLPGVSITSAPGPCGTGQTFADIARKHLQTDQGVFGAHGGHPLGPVRPRSRSPQVKRAHGGEEIVDDGSGFRRQG